MAEDNKKVVMERVYYYMNKKNMNVSDLAKRLGISQQCASAMLKGIRRKSFYMETIDVLADVLNVTTVEILTPLPADVTAEEKAYPDGRRKRKKKI